MYWKGQKEKKREKLFLKWGQFSDPDFISTTHQRENVPICRMASVIHAYYRWFQTWWYIDDADDWWKILDKHTLRNPFSQNKLTIVYIFMKLLVWCMYILSLISTNMLFGRHWYHFHESLIKILSLICFAWISSFYRMSVSGFAFDVILLWEILSRKAIQQ